MFGITPTSQNSTAGTPCWFTFACARGPTKPTVVNDIEYKEQKVEFRGTGGRLRRFKLVEDKLSVQEICPFAKLRAFIVPPLCAGTVEKLDICGENVTRKRLFSVICVDTQKPPLSDVHNNTTYAQP